MIECGRKPKIHSKPVTVISQGNRLKKKERELPPFTLYNSVIFEFLHVLLLQYFPKIS